MTILIEVLICMPMIANLLSPLCNCFLKKNASDIFFVGKQFIDCLTVPFLFPSRGENILNEIKKYEAN